jgi:site-specific DNA-methyltransferase (adenine-specific)
MLGHVKMHFKADGDGYRTNYSGNVLSGSGRRGGESGKPWRGFDPDSKGRHCAVPKKCLEELDEDISALSTHEKLDYLYTRGLLTVKEGDEWPRYVGRVIGPGEGQPLSDLWAYQPYTEGTVFGTSVGIDDDVRWMGTSDAERLGYPTQKPVSLLERIIAASSNPGDVVLDPFCGCGTAIDAAQKLGRRWTGIDITHLAIGLIKKRLRDAYGPAIDSTYTVVGEPVSLEDAEALAQLDKYQFQWWALSLVGAAPAEKKKGADKGIDGRLYFHDEKGGKTKQIVISVKGGEKLKATEVRDLRGVVDREHAEIGVLISLDEPTKPMRTEAATAGHYLSPWSKTKHPRLQLITVKELMEGKGIDYPAPTQTNRTLKVAPKAKGPSKTNADLFEGEEAE